MKQEKTPLPPAEIANSFRRLASPEMRGVVLYLQGVGERALDDMATCGDHDFWRRLQGRYSLVRELLDLVESVQVAK